MFMLASRAQELFAHRPIGCTPLARARMSQARGWACSGPLHLADVSCTVRGTMHGPLPDMILSVLVRPRFLKLESVSGTFKLFIELPALRRVRFLGLRFSCADYKVQIKEGLHVPNSSREGGFTCSEAYRAKSLAEVASHLWNVETERCAGFSLARQRFTRMDDTSCWSSPFVCYCARELVATWACWGSRVATY